jgi:hypothetical protein
LNKIEKALENIKNRHNFPNDRLYVYPCSFNSWQDGTLLIMAFTSKSQFPLLVLKTSRAEEGNQRLACEAKTIEDLSGDPIIAPYLPDYLGIEMINSRVYHVYKGIQAYSLQQIYLQKHFGIPSYLIKRTAQIIDFLAKFHRFAVPNPASNLAASFDEGVFY